MALSPKENRCRHADSAWNEGPGIFGKEGASNKMPDPGFQTPWTTGGKYTYYLRKELGIKRVRINAAGCLNRCKLGPVMVAYPEGVWFRINSEKDVDDFVDSYFKKNKMAKRLLL